LNPRKVANDSEKEPGGRPLRPASKAGPVPKGGGRESKGHQRQVRPQGCNRNQGGASLRLKNSGSGLRKPTARGGRGKPRV